jgi:cytochrome c556
VALRCPSLPARTRTGCTGGVFFALKTGNRDPLRDRVARLSTDRSPIPALQKRSAQWIKPEVLLRVRSDISVAAAGCDTQSCRRSKGEGRVTPGQSLHLQWRGARTTGGLLALCIPTVTAAATTETPSLAILERVDAMDQLAVAMKAVLDHARSKEGLTSVQSEALTIRKIGEDLPDMFPDGSGSGITNAKPEVWERWPEFKSKARRHGECPSMGVGQGVTVGRETPTASRNFDGSRPRL